MSFIKNFINIPKNHSGLLFENNQIKIIQVKKNNKNYSPIYWNTIDFDLNNLLGKTEMIAIFKKIKSNLKTNNINIEIVANDKKTKKIASNLKIAGFQEIKFTNWDYNINYLFINKDTIERTIFALFQWDNSVNFYHVKENHIYKKEKYSWDEINTEKINNFFELIDHKHIFISGNITGRIDEIKERFFEADIKVHVFNIWNNILSFKEKIPSLFKNESHEYLKVISLTLPILPGIKFKEEPKIKEKILIKKKDEIDIDFIIENKKESIILEERITFYQKIKNISNKILFGPKNSKSFNLYKKEGAKKEKKKIIFLPKLKLKLFLPKIKQQKKKKTDKKKHERKKNIIKNHIKKNSKIIDFLSQPVFNKKVKIKIKNKNDVKKINKKIKNTKTNKKEKLKANSKIIDFLNQAIFTKKEKTIQKKKKKIFLPKPKKKLLLPGKKNKTIFNKITNFLNQPIFIKKKK